MATRPIQVVVAFRMLPEINMVFSSHGYFKCAWLFTSSIYRGAALLLIGPLLMEKNKRVSQLFRLQHAIDTGRYFIASTLLILSANMTAGELHDTMKEVGAANTRKND